MPANEKDLKIYSGLFEHVKEKLEENGQTLNCDEQGFVYSVGTAPKKISYKEFENLEGEAFLSCAFLSFFQRLPLDEEKEKCAELSKEEILSYLVNKASYSIRRIELIDCPYNIKPGLRGRVFGLAAAIMSSAKLRKIAKKMPAGIQNKIRGTFR